MGSLIIGVIVVLTTWATFWYLWLRRGKLHVDRPLAYSGHAVGEKLILRFPMAFHNDGPVPYVISGMRLTMLDAPGRPRLDFSAVGKALAPQDDDRRPDGSPAHVLEVGFVVEGRHAEQWYCVFIGRRDGFTFERRTYRLQIEAKFLHRHGWESILDFDLNVSDKAAKNLNERYIAHHNRDEDGPDEGDD